MPAEKKVSGSPNEPVEIAIRAFHAAISPVTSASDPRGEDGVVDYQQWAQEYLDARGLPSETDTHQASEAVMIRLKGRIVHVKPTNLRAAALELVEKRSEKNSATAWAARIEGERLRDPSGLRVQVGRLVDHLSERAKRAEQPRDAGRTPRGFKRKRLPQLIVMAKQDPSLIDRGHAGIAAWIHQNRKALNIKSTELPKIRSIEVMIGELEGSSQKGRATKRAWLR